MKTPNNKELMIKKDVLGGVLFSGHFFLESRGKDTATAIASTPLTIAVVTDMVEKNPNRWFTA
jgi:hypothetical protein